MYDHNLDDLIIDNIEPKNTKTKSFLTIVALMIAVLIVAIILTRILLKSPTENELAFEEEDTTELIAPELKLKETPTSQKEKEEPSLSKIVEEEVKTPEAKTEEPTVVIEKEKIKPSMELPKATEKESLLSDIEEDEIKAPEVQEKEPVTVQEPTLSAKEKEEKDAADMAYWKSVQEERKAKKAARESLAQKEADEVSTEEEIEEERTPEPVVVAPVKKPVKKPTVRKDKPKSVSTGNYYVQVGSFRSEPSSRFISVITNNGFNYTIKRAPDGYKKLLIGPYEDRASANRALTSVKDRINKSAFVVKR